MNLPRSADMNATGSVRGSLLTASLVQETDALVREIDTLADDRFLRAMRLWSKILICVYALLGIAFILTIVYGPDQRRRCEEIAERRHPFRASHVHACD